MWLVQHVVQRVRSWWAESFIDGVGVQTWSGYLCQSEALGRHACRFPANVPHWQHQCGECDFRWAEQGVQSDERTLADQPRRRPSHAAATGQG